MIYRIPNRNDINYLLSRNPPTFNDISRARFIGAVYQRNVVLLYVRATTYPACWTDRRSFRNRANQKRPEISKTPDDFQLDEYITRLKFREIRMEKK